MSVTARGADAAAELKDLLEMMKHVHVKPSSVGEDEKQAAAANTARLRGLRLAKEAADRETGHGQAMLNVKKGRASSVRQRALRRS